MNEITAIFSEGRKASEIIADLKEKAIEVPSWDTLKQDYYPEEHSIVTDTTTRKDKIRSDGTKDVASRLHFGLEKLLTSRMTAFTFALPVKRIYHNTEENDLRAEIAKAMEAIYKYARIDSENIKRGNAYYASCEAFTIWYTVESPNTLYGFPCKYKLKCKSYSPMDGVLLYPLFDEYDDMIAMSFEYKKKLGDSEIKFFETYTATNHYKWKQVDSDWIAEEGVEKISIEKIPGVYICRPNAVYEGLSHIRSELEYTLSRNSDVIAYNSAPILKVAGAVEGVENKGDTRRVYRVENGGDVQYVSWSQADTALKYHVDTLLNMFFMQSQMPDISFENMKQLGNIGYDARMTLLTDAHLKIGEEAGPWIEFLERECNVIKAFLKQMNTKYATEVDNIEVEHIITPYVQNDIRASVQTAMEACGGKAILSQQEAIKMSGLSSDPNKTMDLIREESSAEAEQRMAVTQSMLSGGF